MKWRKIAIIIKHFYINDNDLFSSSELFNDSILTNLYIKYIILKEKYSYHKNID